MSRKSGINEDSLELLLDTICNMFGGIVLIAILLAVLVQNPGKESHAEPGVRVTEGVAKAQTAQLAILSNEINRIEQELSQIKVDPGSAANVTANKISQLKMEKTRVLSECDREQQTQKKMLFDMKKMESRKEVLEAKNKAAATRNVRVPTARLSKKRTVLALIKNGIYYPLTDMSKSGASGRSINPAACSVRSEVISGQSVNLLSLKKDAQGQAVREVVSATGLLGELVANIDPNTEMVALVVYADSFPAFNKMKDMLVAKGIGYTWVPLAMTEGIPPLVSGQSLEL